MILIITFQRSIIPPIVMYFAMASVLILVSGGSIKYILGSMGIGVGVVIIFSSEQSI